MRLPGGCQEVARRLSGGCQEVAMRLLGGCHEVAMIFLQKLTYGQTWLEVEMLSHLKSVTKSNPYMHIRVVKDCQYIRI